MRISNKKFFSILIVALIVFSNTIGALAGVQYVNPGEIFEVNPQPTVGQSVYMAKPGTTVFDTTVSKAAYDVTTATYRITAPTTLGEYSLFYVNELNEYTVGDSVYVEAAASVPTKITVSGDSAVTTTDGEQTVSEYTYSVLDQDGKPMSNVGVKWSLSAADSAIKLDNGVLTINGNPTLDSVDVVATADTVSGTVYGNKTVTFIKTPAVPAASVPTTITVSGNSTVTTTDGQQTVSTYTYSVEDQYKKAMTDVAIKWSLSKEDPALSLVDGVLTINGNPTVDSVDVIATATTTTGTVSGKLTVTFTKTPVAPAASVPTKITVSGNSAVTTKKGTQTVSAYTYSVLDQYGKAMSNVDVKWSLSAKDSALTLVNGVLTADGNPDLDTVDVIAAVGDISGKITVTFTKKSSSHHSTGGATGGTTGGTTGDTTTTSGNTLNVTPETKTVDSKTISTATVTADALTAALKDGAAKAELTISGDADTKEATLDSAAIKVLADKKADLVINTGDISLNVPAGVLDLAKAAGLLNASESSVKISVQISEVSAADSKFAAISGSDANVVGKVFEFNIVATAGGKSVTLNSFGKNTVQGTIPFSSLDLSDVSDTANLTVFKYNEETKSWEFRPTTIDTANKAVVFTTNGFSIYTVVNSHKTFADIDAHWAKASIETLASKLIVNGDSENTFNPDGTITRAEFTSILARALNLTSGGNNSFSDISSDDWFASTVAAAYDAGLVSGRSDSTFDPNATITREEMTVMLVRAYEKLTGSKAVEGKASYSDSDEIADWANSYVGSATELKLVNGNDGMFAPKSDMTRAEGATVILRLLTLLKKI